MSESEPKLEMTRLGGYTIVRKLAKGGMAEIYLAKSVGPEGFEKLVVLKRILPKYAENQRFVQLFLDEAKLAASLDHQNIVSVYDMGRVDNHYFFTMEYVHGQDTRSILRKASRSKTHPIPIAIAAQIARTMAAALHHAHERKRPDGTSRDVVHRDVSPSNILVSYDGAIKLADFGVAKAASSSVRTRTGALKGKVGYMSPEQARGMSIDRRSDIFSLGVVLWELISMRRLFKTDNDLATIQAIINTPPPPLSDFRSDCPPELERIARKALEKEPATRYQTAQELQRDLDELGRELKLDQSSIALSKYMTELFDTEIGAWRDAQSAGSTVTDFVVAHSGPSQATPVSESDLSLDDPEDIEEEDDDEPELEEPSELTALPPQAPRAGVISDEPDDATDFGPPPTMESVLKTLPRAPTARPLAATVPRTPKPPVIGRPNDTEREDNPFDNATTRLRENPLGSEPIFAETPTKVSEPVFTDEGPTVSAPPDILAKAFAETDETVQASPRYTDSNDPTPPPGSFYTKEAPTAPFAKAASTAQYPFPDKKPPPNLPSVPHTSNLDPVPAMGPGVVPKSATPSAPTMAGQPPPSMPPAMPGSVHPGLPGMPSMHGGSQPGSMQGGSMHGQPGMQGGQGGSMPGMHGEQSGQSGSMQPGMQGGMHGGQSGQSGSMQPGMQGGMHGGQGQSGQSGSMQPGMQGGMHGGQSGSMQPGMQGGMHGGQSGQSGSMQPGMQGGMHGGQSGSMQPVQGGMHGGQSGQSGSMQPGMQGGMHGGQSGSMQPVQGGMHGGQSGQSGSMQPGMQGGMHGGQSGSTQPGMQGGQGGPMQPGYGQGGPMQPGSMHPGMQPGAMHPGSMQPGMQPPGAMPVGSFPPGTMPQNLSSTGQIGVPAYPSLRPHTPPVGVPSMSYPSSHDFDPNLSIDLAPQRRWLLIAGIAVAVAVIAILLVVIFSRGSADEEVEPEEPAPKAKAEPAPAAKPTPPKVEPKPVVKATGSGSAVMKATGSGSAKVAAGSAGSAEPKPEVAPTAESKPLPKITKPPPTIRRPPPKRR